MLDKSLGKSVQKTKLVAKGATNLSDLSEENESSTSRSSVAKNSLKATADYTLLSECPLWSLAINGNKVQLQELIRIGRWNVNETDHMVRTPLIYSVLGERLDCVQVLLKAGADINHFDIDHRTALHWAAYQGNHKLVKVLLSKGASNTAKDKEGRTPLHLATSHDNIKVLQTLLQYMNKDHIDTHDNKQWTALCWSVFYDRVDYAKLLLKHGASPTNMDTESRNVLHLTSENKDTSIVKLLLEETRAITNFADNKGRTLLHMAVGHSNYDLVKFLLSLPEIDINAVDNIKRTPLHWAASLKNVSMVKLLLAHRADFSIGDENGVKALHYVTQTETDDAYDCVKVMLETKGMKDIPDSKNGTALMWAAVKGCDNILELLLKKKCSNVNAVDIHNQTALHMSTLAGNLGCVKLLIKNGASVDIVDGKHHIPLFYACASGHVEIVTELLKHTSTENLEGRDLEGRSLLHYAAMVDRTNIIKILIMSKLNPNVKDNAGCPPLHFAAYGGFVHCMNVLLENNAKVNIQDNYGQTALHWACRSGSLDAVKLLVSRYKANVNVLENSHERFTPLDYAILGDHEDVAYYLTENNAYTVGSLKELFATKIQAVWRGFSFRKNFKEKKALLLKHVTLQKASDGNPSESSSKHSKALSEASTNNKLLYNSENKEQLVEDDTKLDITSHHDGNYLMQPPVLHRQRSGSTLSAVSYSSKSSFHQHMGGVPKSPKFSISDDNPMSLRKASANAQSLIYTPRYSEESIYKTKPKSSTGSSVTKQSSMFSTEENIPFTKKGSTVSSTLFRYPSYNRQASDQVFYGTRDGNQNMWSPKKADQPSFVQNGINNQKKSQKQLHRAVQSPISSSGSSEVAGIQLKRGVMEQSNQGLLQGNNLYNRNYSRYGNRELKKNFVSSSSESSFLFQAKQYKNYPPGTPYKKISDAQSINSINVSVISGTDSVYFAPDDTDKPWDIYRREQKRIYMIRQKTEAAIKIQKAFRNFISKKRSGTLSKSIKTRHSINDKIVSNKKGSMDNSVNDGEDDDDDTILNESLSEQNLKANSDDSFDSTDEETLREVAALVIQLGWRQYLKKKLQDLQNLEHKHDSVVSTTKRLPSILVAQPSQDSPCEQESLTPMMEDSDNQSSVVESDSFDSSFEERKLNAVLTEKKKLVSSLSFPLSQSVHSGNMLKKKSHRFSLKKRFLQRANTHTDESNIAATSPYSQTLASYQPNLGKNDIAGLKSGKSKLFLRGKSLKSVEQKMFYNGAT